MSDLDASGRNPTEADYQAGRKFCVIVVDASEHALSARLIARTATIVRNAAEYRINPYGTIDRIRLGEFQLSSWSPYCLSGVILDYAENEAAALDAAREHLAKVRAEFLARLDDHADRFRALDVVVTG